jgi:hypothetical protein
MTDLEKPANDQTVEDALRQVEVQALNFSYRFVKDSRVRSWYIQYTQDFSRSTRAAYKAGNLTAKQAAEAAYQMRNEILEMARIKSSDLGKAVAVKLKARLPQFDELLTKYSRQKFGNVFDKLTKAQQEQVYLEIVAAAGRARPKVNVAVRRMGAAGKGLWLLTAGIAIYNIGTAQNKVRAAGREASNVGGGFLGSVAVGAVGGAWAGPIGAAVGAIIGGVLGAIAADEAYVELTGPENDFVKSFLPRFTSFMSRDETGIADALIKECGINMDKVHAVFFELYNRYSTDADDVANLYIQRVKTENNNILHALKLNASLRAFLARILDEGWTTSGESNNIQWLRAM